MISAALLYFSIVTAVGQAAPQTLTLDEALAIAMKNAFTLRIAETKAQKARGLEKQARGAFGPTINLQGNYSRFDGTVTGSGGSTGGGGNTGGSVSGDSKSAAVFLNQIIDISGIARKALQVAEYNRLAAEAGIGVESNTLKLRVRTAFFNVLLSQALVQVQQEALKAANDRLAKAIVRRDNGAIPDFDVLRFTNEVRKVEQALEQAKGTLKSAKHELNSAMAVPIETDYEPVPVEGFPELPSEPSDLVVEAIRSRSEVKQSEYTIVALTKTSEVQEGSLKPSLSIQASHTRYIDPALNQQNQSSLGNIVLSFPVFDSGITRGRVEAAQRDTDQARIGLEQLLLGIALEVRNALTQAQTAKKTYDVAVDSERLARESLRLAEIRYNEGAGILIDVTQAQADLTAASGNVQNAKYQLLTAYSNLLRAIGRDDIPVSETQ